MRKLDITAEVRSQIFSMRKERVPFRRIADHVNVSLGTVMRIAALGDGAPDQPRKPSIRRKHAAPNIAAIKKSLKRGTKLRSIWRKYAAQTVDAYSYEQFITIVRNELSKTEPGQAGDAKRGGTTAASHNGTPSPDDDHQAEIYWKQKAVIEANRAKVLILSGYGSSIKLRRNELLIYDEGEERRIMPATHGLRAIIVQGTHASITSCAMTWCGDQNIDVIFQGWNGELRSVIANCTMAGVELRRAQYTASNDPLPIAKRIVLQKLASGANVGMLTAKDAPRLQAEARAAENLSALLMVEARAAIQYWSARQFTLKHKPKLWPPSWTHFAYRQSVLTNRPRHATHPVNAMLNYAYTILAGQLTRTLISTGFDPAVGFLHSVQDGRASLVYDALELLRADLDNRLFPWIMVQTWKREDFPVQPNGAIRLQPSVAKIIAAKAFTPQSDLERVANWLIDAITLNP